jgi:hypothetical protein
VDVLTLAMFPVIVGPARRVIPHDVRVDLELVERRDFGSGMLGPSNRMARAA